MSNPFQTVDTSFTCVRKDGTTFTHNRTSFPADVEWIAQQLMEVNDLKLVSYHDEEGTHTFHDIKDDQ